MGRDELGSSGVGAEAVGIMKSAEDRTSEQGSRPMLDEKVEPSFASPQLCRPWA